MTIQHKTLGILAVSAVLAAGLLGTAKPAAASGLTHVLQIGQKAVIAQHFGDYGYDGDRDHQREERRREEFRQEQFRQAEFRRQQELRRLEERRREERQRDHRQNFQGGDRRFDNRGSHFQNNYNQDSRDFDRHDDNR